MACILENAAGGSRKTRLIYGCNLSPTQFNLYEDCLVEAGLLTVSKREDGVEMFQTTEKGREFLRDYRKIKRMLE